MMYSLRVPRRQSMASPEQRKRAGLILGIADRYGRDFALDELEKEKFPEGLHEWCVKRILERT